MSRVQKLEAEMLRALRNLHYPGIEERNLTDKNRTDLRTRVHEFLVLMQVLQSFSTSPPGSPDPVEII